ncbi:MAG: hypothetical protein NTY74_04450 [Ignavibacteriae bacterium]|nr:hypothetical protein [Ignavibacteriota bacterium]
MKNSIIEYSTVYAKVVAINSIIEAEKLILTNINNDEEIIAHVKSNINNLSFTAILIKIINENTIQFTYKNEDNHFESVDLPLDSIKIEFAKRPVENGDNIFNNP